MVYYVIITENNNSVILFSLDNIVNNKFNVCHLKSISNKVKRKIYARA
jgi:hypothetical protein